jgi:ferric-chelate reductase
MLSSVVVCGTHALANAVRSALRPARFMDVLRGGPTVSLHVESSVRSSN